MINIITDPYPVLSTKRLLLRKIGKEDVNEMFLLRSNREAMQFIARPLATTPEDALQLIQKINGMDDKQEAVYWAITIKDNPGLIGTICLWNIEKENARAEVGYMLHPDFHRKGLMQEALSAALDYGFKTMRLHSIEARVDPGNTASMKLLEKNNFRKEAHFKECYYFNGKFLDSVVYSLLASD